MHVLRKIDEINVLLTAERLGLPFSVLIERLSHFAYPNYGIIVTPENYNAIQARSRKGYTEWRASDWRVHALINDSIKLTDFRGAMADMNREVGFLVSGLQRARCCRGGATRGNVYFFDAGTGEGDTIRQVIWQFVQGWSEKMLGKCHFIVNDVSKAQAEETAKHLRKDFHVEVETRVGYAEDVLRQYERHFDFITLNAVKHHISLASLYPAMYRALKDDGAVVEGDYYTGIGETPVLLARFLEMLGANKRAIRDLRFHFNIGRRDHEAAMELMPARELAAFGQTVDYAAAVCQLIKERGIKDDVNPPVEAHRTVEKMKKEARDAGFLVGTVAAKQVFPKFPGRSPQSPFARNGRFGRNTEVADVTVLVKDRRQLLRTR